MKRRSKISDVAAMAGVSKSTVSNYLNRRYANMSTKTRDKIADAIKKLNYTPNISARRLSSKVNCQAVCVVVPMNISRTFETFYYPTVLTSVGKTSEKYDYNILIYARGGNNHEKEVDYLKSMAGTIADGFLLFDLHDDDLYFREFARANIPYICVGKIAGMEDYNYVATDHELSLQEAIENLIALNHKKIAVIVESGKSVVTNVRYNAYVEILKKYNIPLNPKYIGYILPHSSPNNKENYNACKKILLQNDPPTAIILPVGAVGAAEQIIYEAGISVPEDLSIIVMEYKDGYTFRNHNYTRFVSVADVVSRLAFEKLHHFIQNREEEFQSELVKVHMIEGNSIAPARENRTL